MKIVIEDIIRKHSPALKVVAIECDVINSETPELLWQMLLSEGDNLRNTHDMQAVKNRRAISGTREIYKSLGKDPNRYRPSAEALCRRIIKGLELYRINTIVDIINLISIHSGYSIGGFDRDKIEGDTLTLGVGKENEPFEAIGRGELNIENLPVYRDAISGIGTPTSDIERTKLSLQTTKLLMCINVYKEEMPTTDVIDYSFNLLRQFASATNFKYQIID